MSEVEKTKERFSVAFGGRWGFLSVEEGDRKGLGDSGGRLTEREAGDGSELKGRREEGEIIEV